MYIVDKNSAPLRFQLRSMVCFYGSHYHAFVLKSDPKRWMQFDDATVSTIGDWSKVVSKCGRGKIQPSVLFFEAV